MIVQFINGAWRDSSGNAITLTDKTERDVIQSISRMETEAYGDVMPGYVSLDEIESVYDIVDYLDCEPKDAFIWFSSQGPLYFLASIQKVGYGWGKRINFVEIADINGKLTRQNFSLVDNFTTWLGNKDAQVVFCEARESTSNKILDGHAMKKILSKIGFVDIDDLDGMVSEENLIPRIFVKKEWIQALSKTDIERLKSMIDSNWVNEGQHKITEAFNVNPSQVDKNNELEKSVYDQCKKIGSGGNSTGTLIWNWYQKDKKNLKKSELEQIYGIQSKEIGSQSEEIEGPFKEILDKLSLYNDYCKSLGKDSFKIGNFNFKIKNNDGLLKLRSVKGLDTVLDVMNELIYGSSTEDKTFDQNFTMDENDKRNIRFLGSTENLICFVTKNYESTNKFIYGLWRNSNMNSPYQKPEDNSPYCTRVYDNWKTYSHGNKEYEQFWIFLKPKGQIPSNQGDLTDQNIENLYKRMSHKGNELLVGLLDTYNSCNRRENDGDIEFPDLGFKDKNGVDRTEETVSMMDNLFFTDSIEVKYIYSKKTNLNWKEELDKAIATAKEKFFVRALENRKSVEEFSDENAKILKKYLTSIDIPDDVTRIGVYAFYDYKSLASINIPNSVTSIGDYAFEGCTSLTSINIPDSVTRIGNYAFYECTSLASINIPNGVASIGDYVFHECTSLTSITIQDGVTSIGDYAFWDCISLTSIDIPDGVTSIGNYAFCECTSLTSINIPDGVTSIGNSAFNSCKSLSSINIPNSVTSIGDYVFWGCLSLKSIIVSEDSEVYDKLVKEYGNKVKTKESIQLNECQQYWIKRFLTTKYI